MEFLEYDEIDNLANNLNREINRELDQILSKLGTEADRTIDGH
jgi:hypothetical protein